MPQEFQVVQCYSCKIFQVDIVKKVPKWSCKMCGEKQSVKKTYCSGNAKECRIYVQEVNEKRIKSETTVFEQLTSVSEIGVQDERLDINRKEKSKWLEFMQNRESCEENFCDEAESNEAIRRKKLNWKVEKEDNNLIEKRILKDNDQFIPNRKYREKDVVLDNFSSKKFKSNLDIQKSEDTDISIQCKNIFDSVNNSDIDSLLEI